MNVYEIQGGIGIEEWRQRGGAANLHILLGTYIKMPLIHVQRVKGIFALSYHFMLLGR